MGKFKVGDRVRLVADNDGFGLVGDAGSVLKADCGSSDVRVRFDVERKGDREWYASWDKLQHIYTSCAAAEVDNLADEYGAPKAKFKVGDRVRITNTALYRQGVVKVGDLATLTRHLYSTSWDMDVETASQGIIDQIGQENSFEHVAAAPATALRIEAGKFYKTRDGRKVGPMVVAARQGYDKQYPFTVDHEFSADCANAWRADGTFDPDPGEPNDADLIAEWTDEPVAAAQKFKIGDRVHYSDYMCSGIGVVVARPEESDLNDGAYVEVEAKDMGVAYFRGARAFDNHMLRLAAPTTIADIVARHSQTGTAIVAVLENGQPRPATRPYVHGSASAAETEANRLARTNPGKEFGVYTLGAVAKVEKTYDHEWQRLAAGGERVRAICNLRDAAGLHYDGAKAAVDSWLMRAA